MRTPPDGICNPVRNVLCNDRTVVCGHKVRVGITNPDPHQYYRLEQRLLASGHPPRKPGETPLRWLRRLGLTAYEGEVLAFYRSAQRNLLR